MTTQTKGDQMEEQIVKSFYGGMVHTQHNDEGTWKDGVAASFGSNDLSWSIADGFKTASYYLALGYKVQVSEITAYCNGCGGSGTLRVPLKRSVKFVTCKACKGKGHFGSVVPGYKPEIHPNITMIMR